MGFFAELKRRNVIRVGIAYVLVAWVVLQIIDFLLELTDAPTWVLQVFFITAAVGLPIVLALSWIYELTPEGIKLEKDVDRSSTITPQTGRKLDRTIIVLLALTVVLLVAGQFSGLSLAPSPPGAPAELATEPTDSPASTEPVLPSIAVLPFVNMSSDPEQEYFSDGISEEILNSLARVKGLKVAGRTSSFAFKGKNEDLRQIGEALGVEHILEGSVRKQGEQVRITAQLIKADDGFHLWSETFDRELEDIFAIQDEIANAILLQTRIQLLDEQAISSTRVDPIAYQNYVAAKQRIHERTKGGLKVAMNLLKDAVEIAPDFAAAWAQLGIATMLSSDGFGSYGDIPDVQAQAQGKQYLDKALELDPELPEGLAGLGLYWQNQPPRTRENLLKAVAYLEKSLALDPVPIDTSHWLQRALQFTGDWGRVQPLLEQMVQRDPLYWPAVSNLVNQYIRKRRFAEARELNDLTMRYRPELPFRQSAVILTHEGKPGEAVPLALEVWNERRDGLVYYSAAISMWGTHQFEKLVDLEEATDGYFKAVSLAFLGRPEEAQSVAQTVLTREGNPVPMIAALAMSEQHEKLVAYLDSNWPDLAAFAEEYLNTFGQGSGDMIGIARAYAHVGNDAKFRQAMQIARDSNESDVAAGFDNIYLDMVQARYWALAGDQDKALEHLARAVEGGYAVAPRISDFDHELKVLEGGPRFEALQGQALAHLNQQRALLDLPALSPAY